MLLVVLGRSYSELGACRTVVGRPRSLLDSVGRSFAVIALSNSGCASGFETLKVAALGWPEQSLWLY